MIRYLNTRDSSVLESIKTHNSIIFAKFNQISPERPLKIAFLIGKSQHCVNKVVMFLFRPIQHGLVS